MSKKNHEETEDFGLAGPSAYEIHEQRRRSAHKPDVVPEWGPAIQIPKDMNLFTLIATLLRGILQGLFHKLVRRVQTATADTEYNYQVGECRRDEGYGKAKLSALQSTHNLELYQVAKEASTEELEFIQAHVHQITGVRQAIAGLPKPPKSPAPAIPAPAITTHLDSKTIEKLAIRGNARCSSLPEKEGMAAYDAWVAELTAQYPAYYVAEIVQRANELWDGP